MRINRIHVLGNFLDCGDEPAQHEIRGRVNGTKCACILKHSIPASGGELINASSLSTARIIELQLYRAVFLSAKPTPNTRLFNACALNNASLARKCALAPLTAPESPGRTKEMGMENVGQTMPSIGRMVHYVNLGDKDGKFPPEIQAAIITGVYGHGPMNEPAPPLAPGNNDAKEQGLLSKNKLGDWPDSMCVDLRVLYRTGEFNMICVPFSPEPVRGHWNWPPRV